MKNVLTPKQIALFVTFKEKNDEQHGIKLENKKSKRDKREGEVGEKRIF